MSDISKERVGAISDGVIAVAATILVLELKVPEGSFETLEVFLHWSRLMAAWVISFAMIALVWFDNHLFLFQARRWTTRMTVVTFVQLAVVSLIPFASDLAVDHFRDIAAIVTFNVVMFINGIVSVALGRVVAADLAGGEDNDKSVFLRQRARAQLHIYLAMVVIALIGAWFHRPFMGVLLWGVSPLLIAHRLKGMVPEMDGGQNQMVLGRH